MRPLWDELGRRISRMNDIIGELTMGPTLMRLTVVVAAFAGLVLAWSDRTRAPGIIVTFGILALVTGIFPRSPLPTGCALITVIGYIGETTGGTPITVWRVSTLAALIYITHTSAAYASLLPYNAVLTRGVFVPYVMRTVAVIVITIGVAFFDAEVSSIVTGERSFWFTILGMIALVCIAGYVAYLGSRRRPAPPPEQPWRRRNPERVDATGLEVDGPSISEVRERADRWAHRRATWAPPRP